MKTQTLPLKYTWKKVSNTCLLEKYSANWPSLHLFKLQTKCDKAIETRKTIESYKHLGISKSTGINAFQIKCEVAHSLITDKSVWLFSWPAGVTPRRDLVPVGHL